MKIMAYEHVFSITDWIGICSLENEMSALLAWTPHQASEIIFGFKVFIQKSQCHQPLFRSLFMLCFFLLISSDLIFLTECIANNGCCLWHLSMNGVINRLAWISFACLLNRV